MFCGRLQLNIVLSFQIKDEGEWASTIEGRASLLQKIRTLPKRLLWAWKEISEYTKEQIDTHLSAPTNREDGFAMTTCWPTVPSILGTRHRQRRATRGQLQVNLCQYPSDLLHGTEWSNTSLSDTDFQRFQSSRVLLPHDNLIYTASFPKHRYICIHDTHTQY